MKTVLTDEQSELVKYVTSHVTGAKQAVHDKFVSRCDTWDDYYHSYRSMKDTVAGLDQPDRDVFWNEQKSTWGSELRVPYAFSVVETMLPRMLANNPRMLVLPRERIAVESVENMKFIIDAQQEQMSYPMSLQTSGKDGLLYGLAVSKLTWRRDYRTGKKLAPGHIHSLIEQEYTCKVWDDPDRIAVDPRDFIWDQMATSMRDMRWAVHRTWRDTGYILKMVKSGAWGLLPDLSAADLESSGSKAAYNERHQNRARVNGNRDFDVHSNDVHEVWEFHGFGKVIVIVDKKWPVSQTQNPFWHGELPFHIFRPTEVTHNLVGYSVVESIKDLSDEMDELRRARRDNVRIVLQKPFVFQEGAFDPADLQLGPGLGIPTSGDVNESIRPLDWGDIPFSGFKEEDNLRADIERTTGISDSVSGGEGTGAAASTATGIQLTHAATGERIKNMTLRIEGEMVTPEARQMLALNQQYIRENREIRIPAPPDPLEPERVWAWREVGPGELAGGMEIQAIGGSTAAENVPQMRQDGQMLWGMMGQDPGIDRPKLLVKVLEDFGVKNPESFIAPGQEMVPVEALNSVGNILTQMGFPPELVQEAIETGLAEIEAPEASEAVPEEMPPEQAVA